MASAGAACDGTNVGIGEEGGAGVPAPAAVVPHAVAVDPQALSAAVIFFGAGLVSQVELLLAPEPPAPSLVQLLPPPWSQVSPPCSSQPLSLGSSSYSSIMVAVLFNTIITQTEENDNDSYFLLAHAPSVTVHRLSLSRAVLVLPQWEKMPAQVLPSVCPSYSLSVWPLIRRVSPVN